MLNSPEKFHEIPGKPTFVCSGAVGARAASRYGSGSDQMMRLRLRNTGYWVFFHS
jgi:hypothetical protein